MIFSVALYVFLMLYSDVSKFSKSFGSINYWVIPPILGIMTLNLFLLSIRFARLVKTLQIKIMFKKSILIYFSSLSLLATPFGSGQLIKSEFIRRETGEPISKTAPIFFVEKWTELVSVIVILSIFVSIKNLYESQIIIIIGTILSLIFWGIMKNESIFSLFKRIVRRGKFLKKFEDNIEVSKETFRTILSRRATFEGLVLVMSSKMLEACTVFLALRAIGINLDFSISTQVYFVSVVSGILVFIPGGLIITEGSMIGLLSRYYYGLSTIVSAVIFIRLITIWYSTMLGFFISKKIMKAREIEKNDT